MAQRKDGAPVDKGVHTLFNEQWLPPVHKEDPLNKMLIHYSPRYATSQSNIHFPFPSKYLTIALNVCNYTFNSVQFSLLYCTKPKQKSSPGTLLCMAKVLKSIILSNYVENPTNPTEEALWDGEEEKLPLTKKTFSRTRLRVGTCGLANRENINTLNVKSSNHNQCDCWLNMKDSEVGLRFVCNVWETVLSRIKQLVSAC